MARVLVLGARGMLGSMVARVLASEPGLQVCTTARGEGPAALDLPHSHFDAARDPIGPLLERHHVDWIINAVGVIKPRIDEKDPASVENAIEVNALFPYRLATESAKREQRVIQIATDAVFSGATGAYDESAAHAPIDVYGRTKSLGEVPADNVVHLRCSIIGPERPPASSLLGWTLAAPAGSQLCGYANQHWNGLTTLHFAKICAAVIGGVEVPSPQHIVPGDSVCKGELLELALSAFGRHDVSVRYVSGPEQLDRTLTTRDPLANQRLWSGAGYERPPAISEMLRELAAEEARVGGRPR